MLENTNVLLCQDLAQQYEELCLHGVACLGLRMGMHASAYVFVEGMQVWKRVHAYLFVCTSVNL